MPLHAENRKGSLSSLTGCAYHPSQVFVRTSATSMTSFGPGSGMHPPGMTIDGRSLSLKPRTCRSGVPFFAPSCIIPSSCSAVCDSPARSGVHTDNRLDGSALLLWKGAAYICPYEGFRPIRNSRSCTDCANGVFMKGRSEREQVCSSSDVSTNSKRRGGDLNSRGAKHQRLSRPPPCRTRLPRHKNRQ